VAEVIDLTKARRERGPGIEGPARCLRCKFEWRAGPVPVGQIAGFECPQCHCFAGAMLLLCEPPTDSPVWTCGCGNQHYVLTREKAYCLNCGFPVDLPLPPAK
jgi:hypothetical protein